MRRFLAVIGLILVTAGFVLIPLSLFYNINFLIPVGLILASFLILLYVKKMPSDTASDNAADISAPASEGAEEEAE